MYVKLICFNWIKTVRVKINGTIFTQSKWQNHLALNQQQTVSMLTPQYKLDNTLIFFFCSPVLVAFSCHFKFMNSLKWKEIYKKASAYLQNLTIHLNLFLVQKLSYLTLELSRMSIVSVHCITLYHFQVLIRKYCAIVYIN